MSWMRATPSRADIRGVGLRNAERGRNRRNCESRKARLNLFSIGFFVEPVWFVGWTPSLQRSGCKIRRDGADIGRPLPFRNGQDADLSKFDQNSGDDRRGWGWGKSGDSHEPTREEKAWLESYNRNARADRQISTEMAIPDDVLWAYPATPVPIRTEFDTAVASDGSIAPFAPPSDESGGPSPGRWSVGAGMLRHESPTGAAISAQSSFLLNTDAAISGDCVISVWVRSNGNIGSIDIVVAATLIAAGLLKTTSIW